MIASKKVVSIHDLGPYPRLNFVQGEYEFVYFSEELSSSIPVDKEIQVNVKIIVALRAILINKFQ